LSRFFYTPASNTLILALLIFAGALMQKHVSQAAGTKGNYAEGNGLKMYYESSWIWLERIPRWFCFTAHLASRKDGAVCFRHLQRPEELSSSRYRGTGILQTATSRWPTSKWRTTPRSC